MAYKKTNEAWFGDTFDRGTALCYATEAETGVSNSGYYVQGVNLANSGEVTFTCACDSASDTGYAIAKNASINQVDSLSDKIREIQAQINDLKKNLETKKECSELRSALKTLHYKREVE